MEHRVQGKNLQSLLTRPNSQGRVLIDELSAADRRRINQLVSYAQEVIPLHVCLQVLFGPDTHPEAAQTNLRALRMRFNNLAAELGISVRFCGDTNKRESVERRSVWFTGPSLDTELVEEFTRQSVSNLHPVFERTRLAILPKDAADAIAPKEDRLLQVTDGLESLARIDLPTHVERTRFAKSDWWNRESPDQSQGVDAIDELTQWARNKTSTSPFCAVLGEYGIGKTTTLKMLSLHLLDLRRSDASIPLPIYIDLRYGDASNTATLHDLLTEHVTRNPNLVSSEISASDLIRSVREHGSLMIFDGLDEKMVHMDPKRARDFLRVLWSILPISQRSKSESGKIIFSCRSHFFKDMRHQYSLLLGEGREGLQSGLAQAHINAPRSSGGDYKLYIMLPFTEEQIRSYLYASFGDRDRADAAMSIIRRFHDLRNLAERPVLLAQIAEMVSDLEQTIALGGTMNAAIIYERLIALWFGRDDGKHQINPEHKRLMMQELAAHLHRLGVRELPIAELEEWLDLYLSLNPAIAGAYHDRSRDVLKEDLRTATLLVRPESGTDSGYFRFAHTSLHEFFLASYLLRSAYRTIRDAWNMSCPSDETLEFFNHLLEASPPHQQRAIISVWSSHLATGGRCAELAFRVWVKARELGTPEPVPERVTLDGLDISSMRIIADAANPLVIPNASFKSSKMVQSNWRFVTMVGADFSKAKMEHSEFDRCILDGAVFRGARLQGARFRVGSHSDIECDEADAFGSQGLKPGQSQGCRSISFRRGSTSRVSCCSVSADGQLFLAADQQNRLALWSVPFNTRLRSFFQHTARILSCSLSPHGQWAVCSARDGAVHLWCVETGQLKAAYRHDSRVVSCNVAADGSFVVSASADGAVHVWSIVDGKICATFEFPSETISTIAISSDGGLVAMGAGQKLILWNVQETGWRIADNGHDDAITGVIACGTSRFITASDDRSVVVWDGRKQRRVASYRGHSRSVKVVSVSTDGKRLLTSSTDRTVRIWDIESRQCIETFNLGSHVFGVALSADAELAVLSSPDGELQVLDCRAKYGVSALNVTSGKLIASRVSQDRRILAIAATSPDQAMSWSNIVLWFFDTMTGEFLRKQETTTAHDGRGAYTFSADLENLYCCHYHGSIGVIASTTGAFSIRCDEQGSPRRTASGGLTLAAVSLDESMIACGWRDGFEIWDLRRGELANWVEMDALEGCAFSMDGKRLCAVSKKVLAHFDAASGEPLRKISGSFDRVIGLGSSDCGEVVLCSTNHGLEESLITSHCLETGLSNATYSVRAPRIDLGFTNGDGLALLLVSLGEGIQLWDLGCHRPRFTLYILPDSNFAVVNSDANQFVSASTGAWRYFDAISECDGGPPSADLVETLTGPWVGAE